MLNFMDERGYEVATPRLNDPSVELEPPVDFNSGYILRALESLPKQGSKTPWRLHQNYVKDIAMLRYGKIDDGTMEFSAKQVAGDSTQRTQSRKDREEVRVASATETQS